MDQVKVILANIKKYHFWILCGIVVLVGLTSWYMSTSSLDAEAKKSGDDIKAKESAVNNVLGIKDHPNPEFLTGMDKLIEDHSKSVGRGWQRRYSQQKSLLVWPERLGPDFIREVNHLRPIEEYVTFEEGKGYVPSQEISTKNLEIYRNFISQELPELAAAIGTKWTAKAGEGMSSAGGPSAGGKSKGAYSPYGRGAPGNRGSRYGGRSGNTEEAEDDSIVYWSTTSQQEILDEHFKFVSESKIPHTLDVLYAQEDLWVLEAIVNVIKATNAGADANYNAAIKEIESLQIGRTVRGRLGLITPLQEAAAASTATYVGSMGATSGAAMPSATGTPPSATSGTPMTPPAAGSPMGGMAGTPYGTQGSTASLDPATGRYVDTDYNPLSPKDLRAAVKTDSTPVDPKLAIYAVAKRMPVRLRLRMDQRKLNDLLAECGNSSLPIEVRQVRINCDASAMSEAAGATPGYGGAAGYGGSSGYTPGAPPKSPATPAASGPAAGYGRSGYGGGGYGGSRRGAGRGAPGLRGGASSEEQPDPNEVTVDVYGIVHIYNPLNQKQLNTNLREDEGTPAPQVPATPESPTAVAPATAPPRS